LRKEERLLQFALRVALKDGDCESLVTKVGFFGVAILHINFNLIVLDWLSHTFLSCLENLMCMGLVVPWNKLFSGIKYYQTKD
jgi:hypothetical protein